MCLNGFLSQAVSLFYCSLSWQWYIFSIFYSIMVKRKKLWEHIFFYSCLEWRANYLWLWIQTCYLSRFDYSTFVVLFLTSYFIISNWWPIREWNKYFFSARKFRQQLSSRDEVGTFRSWHDAFHCLTHVWRITCWPGRRLSVKKKFVENLILHNIS